MTYKQALPIIKEMQEDLPEDFTNESNEQKWLALNKAIMALEMEIATVERLLGEEEQ